MNNNFQKKLPLISIIVPIYNSEKTLRYCIDSVISQNFDDYELLLVNDGSKDGTQKICELYAKYRDNVKLFNTLNRGAYAARKTGVKYASGKYVTFLDSDDAFKKDILQPIAEELKEDIDLLVTSCNTKRCITKEEYQRDVISNKINAALHGRFFSRDILSAGLIDIPRDFVIGEDFILNLRVSLYAKNIKYSELSIYNYNLNSESITHNFRRSWEYERAFHILIREVFLHQMQEVDAEIKKYYYLSFLKGCKLAILDKSKINYSDSEWTRMKKFLNQHRNLLWWDEKLVLDIPSSSFCRNIIRVLYKFI